MQLLNGLNSAYLLPLVGLVSLFGFGARQTPEERFWQWFSANSNRLSHFEKDRERIFDTLEAELHKIHPDLTFAFGPMTAGRREFDVSADGMRAAFPAVKKLVGAAPNLPGWKIVAFRPRIDMRHMGIIEYGGVRLGPKDVWFTAVPDGRKAGLTLYLRGLDAQHAKAMHAAAFILLDHALGEHDTEMKVGFIDLKPLPTAPESVGLKPFHELPHTVDKLAHP